MSGEYVKAGQERKSLPGAAYAELLAAVLDKGMSFRFSAPGFSMSPFIRDGDVITIASGRPRYGDVVAFACPGQGKLTVHRIVHISEQGFLIKGDNAPVADGRIPRSRILGRVIRVEHQGRQVRVGLGIERIVIAFLSRRNWLMSVVLAVWRFVKPVTGRWFG